MKIFCSELCLIGGNPYENVQKIMQAGIDHIELMLDGSGWNNFQLDMNEIAASLMSLGATYSVHTPVWDLNLTSENAHMRHACMDAYRDSIKFASLLHAKHVVIHPGFCYSPSFDKQAARERAKESLHSLLEFNKPYNQLLLIENVGTPATSIFTQDEYATFLDGMPAQAGYLLDIGHAYISKWQIDRLIAQLGDRLHAVHLHDNNGESDAHLPINTANIDWKALFEAMGEKANHLHLVLEYNIGTPLEKITLGNEIIRTLCKN